MKILKLIYNRLSGMGIVIAREYKTIFRDEGAMLFFFFLPIVYPLIYTLIYNPEIVEDMPIVVVDQSQTADSRRLIRMIDATQSMKVYTQAVTLDQARDMMYAGDVNAIFVIPADYSKQLGRMEPATIPIYCDMSLLLRYRAILSAVTEIQLEMVSDLTAERVNTYGLNSLASTTMPIESHSNMMGDPTQGFASFVIPGIVVLILQQSMLLGITLIGGSRRERLGVGPYKDCYRPIPGVATTVMGRSLAYVILYIPLCVYILDLVPQIFSLPHYGSIYDALLFIFPMLLSTAFLGQTLIAFTKEREIPFLLIVFSSIIFLFLSGLTWPRYAMPDVWQWVGDLVPATWGVEGFVRMNNNAATLAETTTPYYALWILTGVYFLTALFVTYFMQRRDLSQTADCVTAVSDK